MSKKRTEFTPHSVTVRSTSYKIRQCDFGNVNITKSNSVGSVDLLLLREGLCVSDAASCLCDQRLKLSIPSTIYKIIIFNLNKVVVADDQNETYVDIEMVNKSKFSCS